MKKLKVCKIIREKYITLLIAFEDQKDSRKYFEKFLNDNPDENISIWKGIHLNIEFLNGLNTTNTIKIESTKNFNENDEVMRIVYEDLKVDLDQEILSFKYLYINEFFKKSKNDKKT